MAAIVKTIATINNTTYVVINKSDGSQATVYRTRGAGVHVEPLESLFPKEYYFSVSSVLIDNGVYRYPSNCPAYIELDEEIHDGLDLVDEGHEVDFAEILQSYNWRIISDCGLWDKVLTEN